MRMSSPRVSGAAGRTHSLFAMARELLLKVLQFLPTFTGEDPWQTETRTINPGEIVTRAATTPTAGARTMTKAATRAPAIATTARTTAHMRPATKAARSAPTMMTRVRAATVATPAIKAARRAATRAMATSGKATTAADAAATPARNVTGRAAT